jgi:quinol monooxygenase YgiN
VYAISGYLQFPEESREETLAALRDVVERSRQDAGCVDYWWAEDVLNANRFCFFECWESKDAFDAHQAQPYEHEFMTTHVARVVGADAHVLTITERTSATGG